MALNETIIGVAGAVLGAGVSHILSSWSDRSRPSGSFVRISERTKVPTTAEEQLVHFPATLAAKYNAHAALPGGVNPSKDVPIRAYLEQVEKIVGMVRLRLSQLTHYKRVLQSLFTHLDRNNAIGFAESFSEYNDFLWGYIHGRCRRFISPPTVPADPVDVAAIRPVVRLHVLRDDDGDFVIDIENSVHRIGLIWSSEEVPEKKQRAERAAGAVAKDIAEFHRDNLRTLLGAVDVELEQHLNELSGILTETLAERRRFSFLSVTVLIRNRGKRSFCVDPEARLFVQTRNYTCMHEDTGVAEAIADDVCFDLVLVDPEPNGVLEIAAGSSRLLEFSTKEIFSAHENYRALRQLAHVAERRCRVGFLAYTEGRRESVVYTRPAMFSIRQTTPNIPAIPW
ncbi:MAG: hypothetical protein RBS80_13330 [Thermoguttaceae bacterium]|jgi:hypothetical protein|nr:hypothetical protein [Thermoguttaceae bacterium]